MVSSSSQWEKADTDEKPKVSERTLPPWAKKWTPPVVPDPPTTEEVKEEEDNTAAPESKAGGLDWITGAVSGAPLEGSYQGEV